MARNTQRRSARDRSSKYHSDRPQMTESMRDATRNAPRVPRSVITPPRAGKPEQEDILQAMGHHRQPHALAAKPVQETIEDACHSLRDDRGHAEGQVVQAIGKGADSNRRESGQAERRLEDTEPNHSVEDLLP